MVSMCWAFVCESRKGKGGHAPTGTRRLETEGEPTSSIPKTPATCRARSARVDHLKLTILTDERGWKGCGRRNKGETKGRKKRWMGSSWEKVGPKKFNAGADVEAGRRNRGEKLCAIWPPKNAQQNGPGVVGSLSLRLRCSTSSSSLAKIGGAQLHGFGRGRGLAPEAAKPPLLPLGFSGFLCGDTTPNPWPFPIFIGHPYFHSPLNSNFSQFARAIRAGSIPPSHFQRKLSPHSSEAPTARSVASTLKLL